MNRKIKTIKLTSGYAAADPTSSYLRFKVEQITDSIDYEPGQLLEREEVEMLCGVKDWKVTIVGSKQ